MSNLYDQAIAVLKQNDRGTYSVPTHGLYPVQFNWDSAFAALGYRFINMDRAYGEIELLLSAQWPDGMVPHIVFRGDYQMYFPGPDVWGTPVDPPTSGITQPPVAATCLHRLIDHGAKIPEARLDDMLTRLDRWHHWFTLARQDDEGAIYVVHPWESGRDNLTDWDAAMAAVPVTHDLGTYERNDLKHVDASERPTQAEYDRYLSIVRLGYGCGWDQIKFGQTSPFRMTDPGMTAFLLRSERDLLAMRTARGLPTDETQKRIQRLEAGWRSLYNPKVQAFTSRNAITGEVANGITAASFLGPYAGIDDHLDHTLDHFDRIAKAATYMVPSYDPEAPGFDPGRYWRGPVWHVVNCSVGRGLEDIGELDRAARIASDTLKITEKSGFSEYFNPLTGKGLGGKTFSWTASVVLDWALPLMDSYEGKVTDGTH
ncbi:MAG: MGH1-like glycoside hydrolase domain-containing protein [Planktomarina sp.]